MKKLVLTLWTAVLIGVSPLSFAYQEDPQVDQYFPLSGDFAASHILIAFKGADRANPKVTRNKKAAKQKCEELLAQLAQDPAKFDTLAKEKSDGPSAVNGGNLFGFRKGDMAPAFESALKKLSMGGITTKPVKTPFGYHIIRRNDMKIKYYGARQILVAYAGMGRIRSAKSEEIYKRSEEEARKRIEQIAQQLTPDNFETLAEKEGDLQSTNGFVGVFRQGDSAISNQMIESLQTLQYGETSPVISLPTGFAILKRIKVEQRAGARIYIAYQGAEKAPAKVQRSKEEAQKLVREISAKLKADASQFAALAKAHSDGVFAVRGGLLPKWFKGYQHPNFEKAYETLAPGGVSTEPIETPAGFYFIQKAASP